VDLTNASHIDEGYQVKINKTVEGNLILTVYSEKTKFKAEIVLMEGGLDGQFFSNILSDDSHYYFMNNKKMSIPVLGSYSFEGEDFEINPGEGMASYDVGRAHFTYHTNWFWATFSTYLPDGRTFGVNFGDGIGHLYTGSDRATEDFMLLNGTHHKLDITRLKFENL
jgi:hypothetical protein